MQGSKFKNGLNEADVPYEMNKIVVIEPEGCWEVGRLKVGRFWAQREIDKSV